MNEANADAIWERTLQTLRRDDTVSQRVIALLTLSRLMAVVADTALVAAPSTSAKELFENRIAMSLKAALNEAVGRTVGFAVTVDESLLLEDDSDDSLAAPPLTSSSAGCTSCGRCGQLPLDVHTPPFRRARAGPPLQRRPPRSPGAALGRHGGRGLHRLRRGPFRHPYRVPRPCG